jgi:hypothetical protein
MNFVMYGFGLLIILLVAMVFKQGISRSVELFSLRNLYLSSFIIYQLFSPALALKTGNFWFFQVNFPEQTGKAFLLMATVYLAVFLISYHRIKLTAWFAGKLSGRPLEINDYLLMGLAISLTAIAVPLRFMPLGPIARPSVQIAIAFLGIATAISGWVWSARRSNVGITIVVAIIVAVAVALSVSSTLGRRPLIGVAMGFAWGIYYRRARYMPPLRMLAMMTPFVLAAVVAVSAFSAIRGHERAGAQETLNRMAHSNVWTGLQDILGGQSCGSASLWAIEQWPERFETRTLYSFRIMAYWYIPRFMWPEKPEPLGNDVARLAKAEGVNRDAITIPPGVIGFAAAEGGMWAAIAYALFFGQLFRFFDELVKRNPTNVYVVLPVGCCLGQVVGLARGDIAIFTNLLLLGFLATFLVLYVANRMFGNRISQTYMMAWPQYR